MATARRVEPEWLDLLPAHDPRAVRSRRDLRRVNALMANARIVARDLGPLPDAKPPAIAEIGAGDGEFALRLAGALARPGEGASFTLLDRQAIVSPGIASALATRGWRAAPMERDVFDWLGDPATGHFDAIVANLFLHHFEPAALAGLLALAAAHTRCFVACEPRRSAAALAGSHLLGLVGCNDVTRHDAVASVRAGFLGAELSALWPQAAGWELHEGARGLFSHGFVARLP